MSILTKACFTFLCFMLAGCLRLPAQEPPQYSVRHYTDENGLPQNSIKAIAPDQEGFLWFATENGVVRFDGRHFFVFNKSNIPVSTNRFVHFLPGWRQKELFVATYEQQLLSIRNGMAVLAPANAINNPNVLYSREYKDRRILVSQGLPDLHSFYMVPRILVLPVKDTAYYLCTDSSIAFYQGRMLREQLSFSGNPWNYFLLDGHLYYLDEQGRLFTPAGAAMKCTTGTGSIVPRQPGKKLQLFWNIISGSVLISNGTSFYLLQRHSDGRVQGRLVLSGFDAEVNRIASAHYDTASGRLYLGSMTRGLYLFLPHAFSTRTSRPDGPDEVVYAQYAYSDSTVLTLPGDIFSTAAPAVSGRVHLLDEQRGNYLRTLLIDRYGHIWTVRHNTLYCFEGRTSRLLKSWELPGELALLHGGHDDVVWIGTLRNGLYRIGSKDPVHAEPEPFSRQQQISYLLQTSRDTLWVGSAFGLHRVNPAGRTADVVDGLQDESIRCLYQAAPGELWIGTYESGLFLYQNGKLLHFPADRNNYLSNIHCIVEDKRGFFWLSTNKGLFKVSRKDLLGYAAGKQDHVFYYYYNKDAGFNTNEFNGGCEPCATALKNGYLTFPSLNGLVVFNPSDIRDELPDKKLFIDNVELDGQKLPVADTLRLPRRFHELRLWVSTPFFGLPDNLSISYALKREHTTAYFSPLDDKGIIVLSTLPGGSYELIVRKMRGFDNRYDTKVIRLLVPYAYYETWWFVTLIVLLLAGLIALYIKLRVGFVVRKNRRLELKVARRTQKLQNMVHALEQSQQELLRQTQVQHHLIAAIGHDIKTPLRYLSITSRRLSQELDKGADPALAELGQGVYDTTVGIYRFTDNLLQYIATHLRRGQVQYNVFDLEELLGEKTVLFRDIARTYGTEIVYNRNGGTVVLSNRELLGVIVHNLLDNAVKFTLQGKIHLSVVQEAGHTDLLIQDNGSGMEEHLLRWINDEHQAGNGIPETGGLPVQGLGLVIVRQISYLLNIRLRAESSKGQGTAYRLRIPAADQ